MVLKNRARFALFALFKWSGKVILSSGKLKI
jgi:hypothetical protein